MSSLEVRPFRRSDREQVTSLVNAHAAAVVPGASVSVNTVLDRLEREPGEYVVDPWVAERSTLVAERDGRVGRRRALLRYAADERVGESYRDAGEIRWLVFWPDEVDAADALAAASLAQLDGWGVDPAVRRRRRCPRQACYGVPAQWPHVRALYERAGFVHDGHTEVVFLAEIAALSRHVSETCPRQWANCRCGARSGGTARGSRPCSATRSSGSSRSRCSRTRSASRAAAGLPTSGTSTCAEPYRAPRASGRGSSPRRPRGWRSPARRGCSTTRAPRTGLHRVPPALGFRELTRTARGWER